MLTAPVGFGCLNTFWPGIRYLEHQGIFEMIHITTLWDIPYFPPSMILKLWKEGQLTPPIKTEVNTHVTVDTRNPAFSPAEHEWHVWNPTNHGDIYHIKRLAGFLPSTVWVIYSHCERPVYQHHLCKWSHASVDHGDHSSRTNLWRMKPKEVKPT